MNIYYIDTVHCFCRCWYKLFPSGRLEFARAFMVQVILRHPSDGYDQIHNVIGYVMLLLNMQQCEMY